MQEHPSQRMWALPFTAAGETKRCLSVLRSSSALSAQQWIFWNLLIKTCGLVSFQTRVLSTGTAAGHINTVCRSVKQFVSAPSLHAWGTLTAKSNTLFAESDSSHPENLGGGTGFASSLMLPSTPPLVCECLSKSSLYQRLSVGLFDSSWGSRFRSPLIDG